MSAEIDIKEEFLDISSLNDFCRICLLRKPDLIPLSSEQNSVKISETLQTIVGTRFDDGEPSLPTGICEHCLEELNTASTIVVKFQNQERVLRSFLRDGSDPLERLEAYQDGMCEDSEEVVGQLDEIKVEYNDLDVEDQKEETAPSVDDEQGTSQKQVHVCSICGKTYEKLSSFKMHLRRHIDKERMIFKCGDCNKFFGSKFGLLRHQLIHMKKPEEPTIPETNLECKECDKTFSHRLSYLYHVERHKEKNLQIIQCSRCEKIFQNKSKLKRHACAALKQEKLDRIFRCDVCDKTFEKQASFAAHCWTHKNVLQGRFQCKICLKSFGSNFTLKRHEENTKCWEKLPS